MKVRSEKAKGKSDDSVIPLKKGVCRIPAYAGMTIVVMLLTACTVKAVGDPKRPITINAHIVLDIREMKNTAANIEEMVEAGATGGTPPTGIQSGGKK